VAEGLMDWERLRVDLAAVGLNAWGVAPGAPWQEILPGCRSVVVLGSGGAALWEALVADLRAHPVHLSDEDHPLDAFVERALARLDPGGPGRRWVRCAATETTLVDFRLLAGQAGLGWRSKLGLLLHPEHGQWMGLRAACFTTDLLPATGPLDPAANPCLSCPSPCVGACPGGAMGRPPDDGDPGGWDVGACARFHQVSDICRNRCDARRACPVGVPYSDLEQAYHAHRQSGRRMLAASLGIVDEREGSGPFWDLWRPAPEADP